MDVKIEPEDVYNNGKWKVVEYIDGGSYGVVYQVEHTTTEEEFAMKVSRKADIAVEIWALNMFKGNGYFPTIHDEFPIGCAFHHTAIIMDLGVLNLFNLRINNFTGNFEQETALALAYHIFSGLEYLHKKNVLHRDLKETNVVLKKDSRNLPLPIMIIDFGLAISTEVPRKPDARDTFFNKAHYCTPNMHEGKIATKRCDLTMALYFLIEERGACHLFEESKEQSSVEKRKEFETNPEKYVPAGDTWLVDLARCIFSVPSTSLPNYNRMHEIISSAKPGFMPHRKLLHVTDNEGKLCLC